LRRRVSSLAVHTKAEPTTIIEGKLYALGGNVEHDGRMAWVPATATGLAPLNAYVLVEGNLGLLIDTSLPIVGNAVVEQLKSLNLEEIEILLTRPVEFDSMGNAELIIENFNVTRAYAEANFEPIDWTYFRRDAPNPELTFKDEIIEKNQDIVFAPGRKLSLVNAKLKLLACAWGYDHDTGTLFTSDSFIHALAPDPDTRIITAENDTMTQEDVTEHLGTKFKWLLGANTIPLRHFVDDVFDDFDVVNVASNLGCVLTGREVAARHKEMLNEGLRQLSDLEEEDLA
jgi:flavorubredoxin